MSESPSQAILFEDLCYRGTAVSVLFDRAGEILVGWRVAISTSKAQGWELPQGAVDWSVEKKAPVESVPQAAFRETREEIGYKADDFLFLSALNEHLYYDIVDEDSSKPSKYDRNILGCVFHVVRDAAEIDLSSGFNGQWREFVRTQWIDPEDLARLGPPHKREAYAALAEICAPFSRALAKIANQDMTTERRADYVMHDSAVRALHEAGRLATDVPPFPGEHYSSRDERILRHRRERRHEGTLAAA